MREEPPLFRWFVVHFEYVGEPDGGYPGLPIYEDSERVFTTTAAWARAHTELHPKLHRVLRVEPA